MNQWRPREARSPLRDFVAMVHTSNGFYQTGVLETLSLGLAYDHLHKRVAQTFMYEF